MDCHGGLRGEVEGRRKLRDPGLPLPGWFRGRLADRYDDYTGVAIDAQLPMKDARRAMMKGLQSIHGLTTARTEGLQGLASELAGTKSMGAVVSHGTTASHCPQLLEISRPTRSTIPGSTLLSYSARRSLVQVCHVKGLS